MMKKICSFIILLFITVVVHAQEPLYPYVFFDNSTMPGHYFFSEVKEVRPSGFTSIEKKLPVDESIYHSAPNSLHFSYKSNEDGLWTVNLFKQNIRGKDFFIEPKYLSLWVYNKSEKRNAALPQIGLMKTNSATSQFVAINTSKQNEWEQVIIPI
ncbi:MAG: hypothetical protein EOP53_26105, partial [Sphingobacteriales bacterium]